MNLLELKLLCMAAIFVCATTAGLAPLLLGTVFKKFLSLKSETESRFLSDASCFGSGVFMFVCFLGLLPAADRKFHAIFEDMEHSTLSEFPWGFFVVTCGFLVIFTLDKMVHALEDVKTRLKTSKENTKAKVSNSTNPSAALDNPRNGLPNAASAELSPLNYECHIEVCGIFEDSSHGGVPSSLMFLVALGLHSVFEGVAVGLQSSQEKIVEYSVAILLHEIVMALTFGLEVSKSPSLTRRKKILYVLIFTVSIPVGIAMGIGLQKVPFSQNRDLISAIIEAFATGIFLHVIFIEILANEFPHFKFDRHKCRLSKTALENSVQSPTSEVCLTFEKISFICFGFLVMIIMNVFLHGHSH